MKSLDRVGNLRQIDQHNMRERLHQFADQLEEAHQIGQSQAISPAFARGVANVVFSGLGGSAIGGDFIRSYLEGVLPVPFLVNRRYRLPGFVNGETLLIASSYSGDTEETLASVKEGLERRARILAVSSGGGLTRLARTHSFPCIQIPEGYPPRAALGFSVIPLLVVLAKILIPSAWRPAELKEAEELLRHSADSQYGVSIPLAQNQAKQLAQACFRRYPIVYSAQDRFEVVALRWRAQIEENAKALASHHVVPEMNHNEIVGWQHPKDLLKRFVVLLLRDGDEDVRIRLRMNLTRDLIRKPAGGVWEIFSQGKGLLARMFSLVYLGDWVSFYLALLYGVDPTPVAVIEHLKAELAK